MGRHHISSQAECPFYKGEDEKVIYCEGPTKGSSIQLAFAGSADVYKRSYCYSTSCWQKCLIAQALYAKYD